MTNPECAGCGITAADLPDEITVDEFIVDTVLFEPGRDGLRYCQGCAS